MFANMVSFAKTIVFYYDFDCFSIFKWINWQNWKCTPAFSPCQLASTRCHRTDEWGWKSITIWIGWKCVIDTISSGATSNSNRARWQKPSNIWIAWKCDCTTSFATSSSNGNSTERWRSDTNWIVWKCVTFRPNHAATNQNRNSRRWKSTPICIAWKCPRSSHSACASIGINGRWPWTIESQPRFFHVSSFLLCSLTVKNAIHSKLKRYRFFSFQIRRSNLVYTRSREIDSIFGRPNGANHAIVFDANLYELSSVPAMIPLKKFKKLIVSNISIDFVY